MKSFKQYKESSILEGRRDLEKGWTLKNKIVISTNKYDYYHIMQIIREPRKFGLDKKKILKILRDSYSDAPDAWIEDHYESLGDGIVDNDKYIETHLMIQGYCRFVVDKTHGSIEGWNEKSCKMGAKALDDDYLPYERDGFKLFEVKPTKGRPKYITSKFVWYNWLEGKAKRKYVSKMAQFRDEKEIDMKLKNATTKLVKHAEFLGMTFEELMIFIVKNPYAIPDSVIEAFTVYKGK